MIFAITTKQKYRKQASQLKEAITRVNNLLRMREDILPQSESKTIKEEIENAYQILNGGDYDAVIRYCKKLNNIITSLTYKNTFLRWLSENFEISIVAIAVAMIIRAYFFQPFQIPTGSMQPTLYGVHCWETEKKLSDVFPLNILRWIILGEKYVEIVAIESGFASPLRNLGEKDPAHAYIEIAGRQYRIPKTAKPYIMPGEWVNAGRLIWRGIEQKGDHVFVNKIAWNFRRPKRGELMVFKTDGIQGLPQNTYYIKRLIGKPNERVEIKEPYVFINGVALSEPDAIRRIEEEHNGYKGYCVATGDPSAVLKAETDYIQLNQSDYFALGDNTHNSRDSRYWGTVPSKNLVGPAIMVYWPLSRRWGFPK